MGEATKTSQAYRDLVEISSYIARDDARAAWRFLEAAERCFELVAKFSHLGTPTRFTNTRLAGARLFPVRGFSKYVVIFRPKADGVTVLRVVHGSRDLSKLH